MLPRKYFLQIATFSTLFLIYPSINHAQLSSKAESTLCHQWVTGNDSKGVPTWGPRLGNCTAKSSPLLFSVTHENECNTHMACKEYPNDLNYRENILAYMADYRQEDIGKWIKYSAVENSTSNTIQFAIDSLNYSSFISPTGRPVSNGYLFFGMAQLGFNSQVTLHDPLWIEFEYSIAASDVVPNTKMSGNRLMVAASLNWAEAGRTNRAHFFEINLYKTPGYHAEHYNPTQCTADAVYDHCYYDPHGKWAEGKYVSHTTAFGVNGPISPDNKWYKVRVDLFALVKKYQWHHPPQNWGLAKTDGIYIGLESKGPSHIYAKIRNLRITKGTAPAPAPTPTPEPSPLPNPAPAIPPRMNGNSHPVGLFRDGGSGLFSDSKSYCAFGSGEDLFASGYTQAEYDSARQIQRSNLQLPYSGSCGKVMRRGMVRQGSAAMISYNDGLCLLQSTDHLQRCGFRQQDYDSAPQGKFGDLSKYSVCNCY